MLIKPFSIGLCRLKIFVTYVLRRVIENEQRYVMVRAGTENPQVILSFLQPVRPSV